MGNDNNNIVRHIATANFYREHKSALVFSMINKPDLSLENPDTQSTLKIYWEDLHLVSQICML